MIIIKLFKISRIWDLARTPILINTYFNIITELSASVNVNIKTLSCMLVF